MAWRQVTYGCVFLSKIFCTEARQYFFGLGNIGQMHTCAQMTRRAKPSA
jgi:hypothetical protein